MKDNEYFPAIFMKQTTSTKNICIPRSIFTSISYGQNTLCWLLFPLEMKIIIINICVFLLISVFPHNWLGLWLRPGDRGPVLQSLPIPIKDTLHVFLSGLWDDQILFWVLKLIILQKIVRLLLQTIQLPTSTGRKVIFWCEIYFFLDFFYVVCSVNLVPFTHNYFIIACFCLASLPLQKYQIFSI